MNGYDLTRAWYNFKFENPEKCRHIHSDLYFYIVDLWNRFGQKSKFGLPTSNTMEVIGIKSRTSYYSIIKDLCDWKFIKEVSPSKNQNTSRVISLCACSKNLQALDQAHIQANVQADIQTTLHIDKQKTKNKETIEQGFENFWKLYDHKKSKLDAQKIWSKLLPEIHDKILIHVPLYVKSTPDKKFRKHPSTYLNQECWNDEVQELKPKPTERIQTRNDFYDEPSYQRYCAKNNITPEP